MPYAPKIIRSTPDLRRIRDLPRRKPLTAKTAAALVRKWTAKLARVSGVELNWPQAWLLEEASTSDTGIVGFLPVGTGKTLAAELLPVVCEVERSVLVIPAALKEKTFYDRRELRKQWKLAAPPPRIITREEFSREAAAGLLEELRPELLINDEADEGANFDASVTQRQHRYIKARRAAGKRCLAAPLTGTPGRKSILDYWHLLYWGLGEDGMPVPNNRADAELWALALDDGKARQGWRPKPGALGATLNEARAWYAARLRETRGVIIVDQDSAGKIPLTIKMVRAPDCPEIEAAFEQLAREEESPGGEVVTNPLSLQRLKNQLGCGFYRYFDPPPPVEWADARRASAKLVRARIHATRHAFKPLDTEAQVFNAHPDHPAVVEWLERKPEYDPDEHAQIEWLSDVTLTWAEQWLADAQEPSVLWGGSTDFLAELAERTRLPYYGPKGREVRSKREIVYADPAGRDQCFIASWHANKRGLNLQAWRQQAIVWPPQSAKILEQVFGRPHRQRQTKPVTFTILCTSGETIDSMHKALSEAGFLRDTASSTQKILRAKLVWPRGKRDGYRWIETWDQED